MKRVKRVLTVLTVALLMVTLIVVMAALAFADPKGGAFKPGPDNPDLNFKSPNQDGFR